MSPCRLVARPLARHLLRRQPSAAARPFSAGPASEAAAAAAQPQPTPADLDPNTVLPEFEAQAMKAGKMPVGSRRRRVALRNTPDIPFEQLPYQAFQEARKILAADRQDKIARIAQELGKIAWLEARDPSEIKGGEVMKKTRLASLRREVERLKILADINDPLVKKRFEDGLGDMNKPIYRYYAEKKWRSYDHRVVTQRIKQFHIVPDLLPALEPAADVQLSFRGKKVPPGQIVDSAISEHAPRLRVQLFDKGERLFSVAVVDPDVPDVDNDGFTKRCHFLAANIPLSPTQTSLPLSMCRPDSQVVVPWLPPFAHKGAPYHRLAIFVLEQTDKKEIDVAQVREFLQKKGRFSVKALRDKYRLHAVGFNMFRTVWDDNMAAVMQRHGLEGAGIEFRPRRVYSLKPHVKPRGWEAKRQGPKYRQLWKYTKCIRGLSNARGWTKRR